MLVLAALATLALIGSLASVSDSSIGEAFPGRIDAPAAESLSVEESEAVETSSPADDQPQTRPPAGSAATRPLPPTEREREIARWLKALTYAVLALAAVAAAGVVALVRIGGQLSRVAGR